jgi:Carboxypeptidase regulatory-like domain
MEWFGTQHLARLRRRSTHLVWTSVLVVLATASAAAQDSRGSIGGRIADSSGGVLPGATVTIVNNATNSTSVVITGDGGTYTAPFLISGSYRITVELPGFRTTVRETGSAIVCRWISLWSLPASRLRSRSWPLRHFSTPAPPRWVK